MANVKSEGHMLITAGRAYSCFETRSHRSGRVLDQICALCSLRRSITSQKQLPVVSVSPLPIWWLVFRFLALCLIVRGTRMNHTLYLMHQRGERKKKRELLFPEACIASKEIVAAYTWTEQWNTWMAVIVAFSTRCYKWKRVNQYNFIRK